MRIAQVAPLAKSVPPKLYGGTERVVSWHTEELVNQGHEVSLFASGNSKTSAKLVPVVEHGLRLAKIRDFTASTLVMLDQVCRREKEFDIIHFHVDVLQLPSTKTISLVQKLFHKCVTTLHGRLDLPDFHPIYEAFPAMPLVSISDNQRLPMPGGLNWISTIHHGLPFEFLSVQARQAETTSHFLVASLRRSGQIERSKSQKKTLIPIKIAAKVDPVDQDYFDQVIKPLIEHPLVEFIGEIDDREKQDFLGGALGLLFPIDWPEPFGLVMIEAMSAGTPVIAWRNGSVPEVVEDGITGIVVNSMREAVHASKQIHTLSRRTVRRRFESRFTASKMADQYVAAYEDILGAPGTMPDFTAVRPEDAIVFPASEDAVSTGSR